MNADSVFQIGAAHTVCQDYARARAGCADANATGQGAFVILCDGCTSSPDTDTGARLLAMAAEQLFTSSGAPSARETPGLHLEAARRALEWAEMLGLPPQAVDATLMTAHLDGGDLIVACTGDGVVCLGSRGGALDAFDISFPSGYPLYPSYAQQTGRLITLLDAGRAAKQVQHFRADSAGEPLRLRDERGGESLTEVFAVPAGDYLYAALFSDGVHSFYTTRRTETGRPVEAIPFDEVLRELVSFKSTRGSFVGRRARRFLKDCQARGWQHADDLAVAALHLGG
jgi:hypothetical protein